MTQALRALLVLLMWAIVTAAGAAGQTSDASGRWDVQINAPDGAHKAVLILKKEGQKLTGTISNEEGEIAVEGTQKGPQVALSFDYPPEAITIKMTGAQDGDSISGPATFGSETGDWIAKRLGTSDAPAATAATRLDISGTWQFEVTSPAGTGTPTITFRQSGDTLAGQYVGQLGEAPVKGTLKGDQLSFEFDVALQDAKIHVVYTGVATKDALKGTAAFGDLGQGTFTARRK